MAFDWQGFVARYCDRAKTEYFDSFGRQHSLDALARAGIDRPLRIAHFLAQITHESGGLTILRESLRYRPERLFEIFGPGRSSAAVTLDEALALAGDEQATAERVYGHLSRLGRKLGNDRPGDGWAYRGNGLLQVTGRDAHRRIGAATGLPLEAEPERCTDPEHAVAVAAEYWRSRGINEAADRNDIVDVTRRINGGTNGLADRRERFTELWPLVQPSGDAADEVQQPDRGTERLQTALNDLGCAPLLQVDGRFGPRTEAAVRWFQKEAGIPADGVPGPVTWAALEQRLTSLR